MPICLLFKNLFSQSYVLYINFSSRKLRIITFEEPVLVNLKLFLHMQNFY